MDLTLTTEPTLIHVAGRPTAWLMPSGRVYPFVAGADEGEGGEGGQSGGAGGEAGAEDGKGGENKNTGGEAKVDMTQAELDKLIADKTGKAKGDAEASFKKWLKDQAADETTREKNRADEAEQAATKATETANARLIRAEAKEAALAAKANPDRVNALLKLADLSDITVGDDGEVDPKAVRKAIDAALKEYPEFKAGAGKGGASGGEHNGGDDKKPGNLKEAVAAHLAGT